MVSDQWLSIAFCRLKVGHFLAAPCDTLLTKAPATIYEEASHGRVRAMQDVRSDMKVTIGTGNEKGPQRGPEFLPRGEGFGWGARKPSVLILYIDLL